MGDSALLSPTVTEALQTFETHTLATLSCDFQPVKRTTVCSISSASYVVIAIDHEVTIFNEGCGELVCKITLASTIDCLALNDEFQLLLIAQNDGVIQLFHIPSEIKLWSLPLVSRIENNGSAFKNSFFTHDSVGLTKVCLLTANNEIYTFSNFNLTHLAHAIHGGCLEQICNNIIMEKIDVSAQHPEFISNYVFEHQVEQSTALGLTGGGGALTLITELQDNFSDMTRTCGQFFVENIVKLLVTKDGRYFIALDSEHHIRVFCSETLIPLMTWEKEKTSDFILIETTDSSSCRVVDCKIGLMTFQKIEDSCRKNVSFKIYEFPSFQLTYIVHLGCSVWLTSCRPNQDYIYIIEEVQNTDAEDNLKLEIKGVREYLPDVRLAHLLNKRKFSEGEEFAALHDLDVQIIYKTKANCILEDLSKLETTAEEEIQNIGNELEHLICKIQDIDFIKSCLIINFPSMNFARRLFVLCNKLLVKNICEDDYVRYELLSEVSKTLNRMCTFEILLKMSSNFSVTWQEFLNFELLEYFLQELRFGSMQLVYILWQRHQKELVSSLTEEKLEIVFQAFPDSLKSHILIPFLRDSFLPNIFFRMPSGINIAAEWLVQKTYMLEIMEKDGWPYNGIQLLELLSDVRNTFTNEFKRSASYFSSYVDIQQAHGEDLMKETQLGCLAQTIGSLKKLSHLKEEYGCCLSLADFNQENKMSTIFLMLDQIETPFAEKFVFQFLKCYAVENNLDIDVCLNCYVKEVLQSSPYTWWHWEEAPWVEKLVILNECIKNHDLWMESAMAIVFQSPIPWSSRVQKIVEKGMKADDNLKQELVMQTQLVKLKHVLIKYDLRNFPLNSDCDLVKKLVGYILKQNKDTFVNDVLNVYEAYDDLSESEAYLTCLQFLLIENRLDEMLELLSTLSKEMMLACSESLLRVIISHLEDKDYLQNKKTVVMNLTVGGIMIMKFQQASELPMDLYLLSHFTKLSKLQKEFDICVAFSEMSSQDFCWILLSSVMDSVLDSQSLLNEDNMVWKQRSFKPTFCSVYRLGDILELEREEVIFRLIQKLSARSNSTLITELCGELVKYYTLIAPDTLLTIVKHISTELALVRSSFLTIIHSIFQLASSAVTFCNEDSLMQCLTIWEIMSVLNILSQSICPEYSWSFGLTCKSTLHWSFKYPMFFKDEALWLHMDRVIDFLEYILPGMYSHKEPGAVVISLGSTKELIDYLMEKGHGISALKVVISSLILSHKYIQDQTLLKAFFSSSNLENIVNSILQKIICQKKADMPLFLGLLTMLKEEKAMGAVMTLLKTCCTDIHKMILILSASLQFAKTYQRWELIEKLEPIHTTFFWMSKLPQPPMISMKNIFLPLKSEEKWDLATKVSIAQKLDLDIIYQCSSELNVNCDDVLIVCLNHLLDSEVNKFSQSANDGEIKLILEKAKMIVAHIKNDQLAFNALNTALKVANSYCYEVLIFIHEHLLKISQEMNGINCCYYEKGRDLLQFLLVYKRISPPSEREMDEWLVMHPLDKKLPSMAYIRLPFHLIFQKKTAYKIINPELNVNTANVWLTVPPSLELQSDHLLMVAAKNTVTNYLSKLRDSNHETYFHTDLDFMNVMENLVHKIKDLEMAVVCSQWIANRLPSGESKVLAFKYTVTLAKEWISVVHEKKVKDVLQNVEEQFQYLAIENVLTECNLANGESAALLLWPKQLIEHLIENCCSSVAQSAKVWKATQRISEIIQFDPFEMYCTSLCKWISPSPAVTENPDESYSILLPPMESLDEDVDEKNMKRIIYFLLAIPKSYLLSVLKAIFQRIKNMGSMHKTRFFCSLLVVADSSIVDAICGFTTSKLKECWKLQAYVAELECLHIPFSISTFGNSSKLEVVKKLLSDHSHDTKMLVLCVKICIEYKVWHSRIWEIILQGMTDMAMVEELKLLLHSPLADIAHVWQSQAFISAWNFLISTLLKKNSSFPLSTEDLKEIYGTMLRCPCVAQLDLLHLTEKLECAGLLSPLQIRKLKLASDHVKYLSALKECTIIVQEENEC